MTENLDNRKYKLIQKIIEVDNENQLSKIESEVEKISEGESVWSRVIKPIKETISIEEMIKEQNYTPISKEEFFKLAEELNIEESVEELLSQLD